MTRALDDETLSNLCSYPECECREMANQRWRETGETLYCPKIEAARTRMAPCTPEICD